MDWPTALFMSVLALSGAAAFRAKMRKEEGIEEILCEHELAMARLHLDDALHGATVH